MSRCSQSSSRRWRSRRPTGTRTGRPSRWPKQQGCLQLGDLADLAAWGLLRKSRLAQTWGAGLPSERRSLGGAVAYGYPRTAVIEYNWVRVLTRVRGFPT